MLTIEHVEYIPEEKEPNTLYISKRFNTAVHLCACGCDYETVTPLNGNGWQLSETDNGVTLHPSIGNQNFDCKSHYWIKNNQIVWC